MKAMVLVRLFVGAALIVLLEACLVLRHQLAVERAARADAETTAEEMAKQLRLCEEEN